ncbi:unnamed protein product [Parnassius apollo]|uniref:(apollo) hypothetical protein n=1 Tax=Parnassius apollo TaxID=110799 RepID=A0A8S3YB11_PARAO|nr:unnamed protein product [Parnassius apollo]
MQYIDGLKHKIDGAGGSVAVAKSSQLHEEKGSGAPRRDKACGLRGARGGARGGECARTSSPRHAARLLSVARRLCLCLCDSRRSVHRTRAPNTTRAAPLWPRTATSVLPAKRFTRLSSDLL